MVATMAPNPMIFALANPTPEILPEEVHAVRNDAIIATGRTDYPNQVNNVLCFPYIFRGALDSGATTITIEMEIAAVHAIAELAQAEQSEVVTAAYAGATLSFGREYLIPKPFDPRLMMRIAPAVAQGGGRVGRRAAADRRHGGLPRQAADLRLRLGHDDAADLQRWPRRAKHKRVAFAEGEEERVLRAVQVVVDENLARPTLIGRPEVIAQRIDKFGLRLVGRARLRPRQHRERPPLPRLLADLPPHDGAQGRDRAARQDRDAPAPDADRRDAAARPARSTACSAAPGARTAMHLHYIDQVIGLREGAKTYACMNALILPGRQVMLVDTHVNYDPTAEQLAEITVMAAEEMLRFGLQAQGGAAVAQQLRHQQPAVGGEDARGAGAAAARARLARGRRRDARRHRARRRTTAHELMPDSPLTGEANLLVLPNIDAANITYNLLKTAAGGGIAIGPVLLGRGPAGAHPDAVGHGAPHHQHDGADGRRRQRSALKHESAYHEHDVFVIALRDATSELDLRASVR